MEPSCPPPGDTLNCRTSCCVMAMEKERDGLTFKINPPLAGLGLSCIYRVQCDVNLGVGAHDGEVVQCLRAGTGPCCIH